MTTINADAVDLGDAEEFKQPADGIHEAMLTAVELGTSNKGREQFVLTVTLSPEDKEAPNMPMRYYMGWPVPADKETMWGSRTAYGSMIQTIKSVLTAVGGPESGQIDKKKIETVLNRALGKKVKIKIKSRVRTDTGEMAAGVDQLLPA